MVLRARSVPQTSGVPGRSRKTFHDSAVSSHARQTRIAATGIRARMMYVTVIYVNTRRITWRVTTRIPARRTTHVPAVRVVEAWCPHAVKWTANVMILTHVRLTNAMGMCASIHRAQHDLECRIAMDEDLRPVERIVIDPLVLAAIRLLIVAKPGYGPCAHNSHVADHPHGVVVAK